MITVKFHCSGCSAEAEGTAPLYRKFESMTGRSYGIGSYTWDTPNKVTPEGWTAADMVGATYCPACTKEIEPLESIKLEFTKETPHGDH